MINLTNINKVLVIRLSSLGDILLTTPILRILKKKKPSLEIDFLVKKEFSDAVKHNPNISKVFPFDKNEKDSIIKSKLKSENFDLVIDLQNKIRSRGLSKGVAEKIFRFKKPSLKKFLLVKFKWNRFKEVKSIPKMYAESIDDLELDDEGLELFIPENIKTSLNYGIKYAGLCPGSKHFTKMWPKQYFLSLVLYLKEMGYEVLLLGGKEDRQACGFISEQSGALDLSNDNELFLTAANMKQCEFIVCNDSGLMHTASALNVPLIAIFGSTVKEFGFRPYRCKNLVLENNSLTCRPCSHIGLDNCPKKHFKCMIDLDPLFVKNNIINFLKYL